MTLHPIAVVDQVLREYRGYLFTEFRARDEGLRNALEEALDQPGFLAQEPFFQAHRPFKAGKRWKELGIDAALATAMEDRSRSERAYLHQSEAIDHLLSPEAGPLAVTTGTGSGKTECFLLPVIQNAIQDSTRFKRNGITAFLVYPMNALANDQEERIRDLLEESGHTHVEVARYDRSTKEEERARLRKSPPHILLTNYMMLEYLLVRPSDREALFSNHRCRFVVLDEVHTYRGTLGANIALLFRRLKAHLGQAVQDWGIGDHGDRTRFPDLLPVATSATIKSIDEQGKTIEERRRLRDEAVRGFLAKLTGFEGSSFKVVGESIRELEVPPEAAWPSKPVEQQPPDHRDPEVVRRALAALAGAGTSCSLDEAARRAGILWKLNQLLIERPRSVSGIVDRILEEVPERRGADREAVRREVEAALVAGAALSDEVPGALRLRTHRFLRGGWQFHRCVDPLCGRLYPMGEDNCSCGKMTAPLYICRSCGADTLRFREQDPALTQPLLPYPGRDSGGERLLYRKSRQEELDQEDFVDIEKQMKDRPVLDGSFDPATCCFSTDPEAYPVPAALAPARNRCLVCGSSAGRASVLTPVALGTSAAVRVVSEGLVEGLARQNRGRPESDGKERLLIFSDSRQDAAHQARFITYAGRYDRMRRRLMEVLRKAARPLAIEEAVRELTALGVKNRDNPRAEDYEDPEYLPQAVQARARAWEEAPLLDDLAVSAGYRATVLNLGLAGMRYQNLERHIDEKGAGLAAKLGISSRDLIHLSRAVLDEVRRRGALSRSMLTYHPSSPNCPEEFQAPADWERRVKKPAGYACTQAEHATQPLGYLDQAEIPDGILSYNAWRRTGKGGKAPGLERKFKHLLKRLGGAEGTEELLLDLLGFLMKGPRLLQPTKLHGFRKEALLLQVNADAILLEALKATDRFRCSICNVRMAWSYEGAPCPSCPGKLRHWEEGEALGSRYAQRILEPEHLPLVAGEHTAQITGEERTELEQRFKAPPGRSPVNVLACSPTLELGIDVGGLDAVVLRNIPPRPDNYAQRGGRAGRRSRVGIVLGYARSTPHDGYFYDKPQEMIAGEVPAPSINVANRDVVMRHLHAIAFGSAKPGLAGRMVEYLNLKGDLQEAKIEELIDGLKSEFPRAAQVALEAWGPEILDGAGLSTAREIEGELAKLPGCVRDLFQRVSFQLKQLEETIKRWSDVGKGDRAAVHAMDLKRRLLGIRGDRESERAEADDRTSGHPLRRFAEFGILPGYEFPNEPSTLRLLNDRHEEEPITVERRFGIAQYQPEAPVHARGQRWRVEGLDLSSPWNPKSPEPSWIYTICKRCKLRYGAQEHVSCPRCRSEEPLTRELPGHEFGGFLAFRSDAPVLEEEDRFAMASLVEIYPQWSGDVTGRFELATGWQAQLRRGEEVRWVNEGKEPTPAERATNAPALHDEKRGFYLCPHCGRVLSAPEEERNGERRKGRRKPSRGTGGDPYGHSTGCPRAGVPPKPCAITTHGLASTLRIVVPLPLDYPDGDYRAWGLSLGYAFRTGLRHLYMLDGPEIEFVLEPMWEVRGEQGKAKAGCLTFIDPAVGGSGFLDRAAEELHLVARRAMEHLDHPNCDGACYRCLKSYENQRHHQELSWPLAMPSLEDMSQAPSRKLPASSGDFVDPRPWLEAYAAGVGSPLELRFLRLFEARGLKVEKQAPVAAMAGGPAISTADFVVPGSRVAIYVDGAAFHRGPRLRRDRVIRKKLREGDLAWKVFELTAGDLRRAEQLVEEIRVAVEPTRSK